MNLQAGSLKIQTKLINLYPDSSRKKGEKAQINTITNKKAVISDTIEAEWIIRPYDEQLYTNKMYNLEKWTNS